MTEVSEAPRPAPSVEASRAKAIPPDQRIKMNQVISEIAQSQKNSPQVVKQIEQMQEASSTGEGQQAVSSSHQALQELAKGVRVTKIDRFIYKAVQDAGENIAQAMQQLQAGVENGSIYNIAENHITNPRQLAKVCRAAGVDYQEVQGQVIAQYGELPPDQALALEILAFRDILKAHLSNQETFQGAYGAMFGRMNNEKTREKYKELTGEELTIENVIGLPNNAEDRDTAIASRTDALKTDIKQVYDGLNINDSQGNSIRFEELATISPDDLAQAVYNSVQTGDFQSQIDIIDTFRKRGRRLIMQANGSTRDDLVDQQNRLIKLVDAYRTALNRDVQPVPLPVAA